MKFAAIKIPVTEFDQKLKVVEFDIDDQWWFHTGVRLSDNHVGIVLYEKIPGKNAKSA